MVKVKRQKWRIRGSVKGDTVQPSTENVVVRELLVYNQWVSASLNHFGNLGLALSCSHGCQMIAKESYLSCNFTVSSSMRMRWSNSSAHSFTDGSQEFLQCLGITIHAAMRKNLRRPFLVLDGKPGIIDKRATWGVSAVRITIKDLFPKWTY